MLAYTFTLTNIETLDKETFYVSSDTCETDADDMIVSFQAYAGDNADNTPHFIPYILSHDSSYHHILSLKNFLSLSAIGLGTAKGFVESANDLTAIRKGPDAMRSYAITGGVTAFIESTAVVIACRTAYRVLAPKVMEFITKERRLFYVSPYGKAVFAGPLTLRRDAVPIEIHPQKSKYLR